MMSFWDAPPESLAYEALAFLKIVGAMFLGGLIGFERELAKRPAGFRTHMFVAGASALVVRLSTPLLRTFTDPSVRELVDSDPFRTIGAVMTGIAFLGAGSIIQRTGKMQVSGLTTAASLFFAGAIGMTTAVELWLLALLLTGAVLVVLVVLNRFERWVLEKKESSEAEES